MSRSSWISWTFSHSQARRTAPQPVAAPKTARLFLEQLETRVVPSFGLSTLGFFTGGNGGAHPQAGLIMDGSGNLYGTTYEGGPGISNPYGVGDGTVFEVVKGSSTVTTLASFLGPNGANPAAGLIMDSSGNLYGTT